ncbi:MAG: hypothetical protein ACRDBG_01415 [Waterburya sp.]
MTSVEPNQKPYDWYTEGRRKADAYEIERLAGTLKDRAKKAHVGGQDE